MKNSILVQDFIEKIWNNRTFERLDDFLHPDFKDYSLPEVLSPNKEGTKKWITNTSASFEHNTIIEEQVSEADKVIIKIRMDLKHIGVWRNIEPTGIVLHSIGYRYFKLRDEKIIEHWGLIDGTAIENQLKNASHGCKIAE